MNDLYQQIVLDHAHHPIGAIKIDQPTSSANLYNAACGDEVEVQIIVKDQKLVEVACIVSGCALCTASGSMMSQIESGIGIRESGKITQEVKEMFTTKKVGRSIKNTDLESLVGVGDYPSRVRCVMLPWEALTEAIKNVR